MKTRFKRFGLVLLAIALGVLLVAIFTFAGKESEGPLESFFSSIQSAIRKTEDRWILSKRQKGRVAEMQWFTPFRENMDWLRNPDQVLIGAYDDKMTESFQAISALEDSLDTLFPLIQIYTAWGSKREQRFPASEARAVSSLGSIPLITWEPWLVDFSKTELPGIPDAEFRDKEGLKSISRGVYNQYIDRWAMDAKAFGKPIFVRFAHEMNDPYRYPWGPQNNDPSDFIAAWQFVVERFRDLGVNNVLWVWSPHPAYGQFDLYYPGNDFVDWVGVGTLNYGTVAPWSKWWTFDEIFGNHYEALSVFQKPIMISEFGSLSVGGDRVKWFEDALSNLPSRYPSVKSLVFFHCSSDATTTYQTLNWYFKNDPAITSIVSEAIRNWD